VSNPRRSKAPSDTCSLCGSPLVDARDNFGAPYRGCPRCILGTGALPPAKPSSLRTLELLFEHVQQGATLEIYPASGGAGGHQPPFDPSLGFLATLDTPSSGPLDFVEGQGSTPAEACQRLGEALALRTPPS
jgi:hypothetical protein